MYPVIRPFAILLVLLWSSAATAASDRVALVIGMGAYRSIDPLENTLNDSSDMAETLSNIGFDVTLAL